MEIQQKWKYNIQYNVYVSSFGRLKNENKKLIQPCVKNNYLVYIINIVLMKN